MKRSWQKEYERLTHFISTHSGVRIKESSISIAAVVREEFYNIFDAVRISLAHEKIPQMVADCRKAASCYLDISRRLVAELGLENILLPSATDAFMRNPELLLVRNTFDCLFDLLRWRLSRASFEANATEIITGNALEMQQASYDLWCLLSIVSLCRADGIYTVPVRQLEAKEVIKRSASINEPPPKPFASKEISFKPVPNSVFTVPQVLLHSSSLGCCLSARIGLTKATRFCNEFRKNTEMIPIDRIKNWHAGAILLYLGKSPAELSIVADSEYVRRPDILIFCLPDAEDNQYNSLEPINTRHAALQPRLGTFIVSKRSCSIEAEELDKGISILEAGFSQSMPEPIISTITQAVKETSIFNK